ncbi:MAG: acyl-CoA desaturase, partial [Pseudomonadota bacterium]
MPKRAYCNPRIDVPTQTGDPVAGEVRVDARKVCWVGGMWLLGTVGSALTVSAGAVLLFIVSTLITLCLGHSLGMHRRFIHRSYQCPAWVERLLVHFGVLVGLAGPLGMLHTHDLRDWAQRQPACHPYFSHGSVWYRDLLWQHFCCLDLSSPPQLTVEHEIAHDPWIRFMERTWMAQQVPWALLSFLLGGWGWVCWGIASRVSVSILGHWWVGYYAHNTGEMEWHVEGAAVQGRNVRWTALLTMGENWHNNHHAFPGSARLGLRQGQWDPGWWVLQLMARLGLA